jgi:hypothetical protein
VLSGWCCTFAWCRVSCRVGGLVAHEMLQIAGGDDWLDDAGVAENRTLI